MQIMKLKDIENIENIKLDYKTLTDTALINKYNISRYNIKKIVKKYNLEKKQEHILNDKDIETFKKEFPVVKNEILAQKHKVAESTIRMWGAKCLSKYLKYLFLDLSIILNNVYYYFLYLFFLKI